MENKTLVEVQHLQQYFPVSGGGLLEKKVVKAVDDVSFFIRKGETLGLVGESGCGKSTLGKTLLRLYPLTAGKIMFDGEDISQLKGGELRRFRCQSQMIFQDPSSCLNPRRKIAEILTEPYVIHKLYTPAQRKAKILELCDRVGLSRLYLDRYPHELSGGQKQRVGIARALASDPKILLCDEATSALDPQTTKSILQLIRDINQKLALTVVVITHEMQVIKDICDKVAVIENGVIAEKGTVLEVFTNPRQPITREFISVLLSNELPSAFRGNEVSQEPQPGSYLLLRLTFIGESADDPVIAGMIRQYDIEVTMLFGTLDQIKSTPYGRMIIGVTGQQEEINRALDYLKQRELKVEVIGYVQRHDSTHQ